MVERALEQERPHRLSRIERFGALAVLLGIFFFGGGRPVWENPFDVDRAVWLSYLPIPFIVLALLALHRRLGFVSWFLNTMELTLVKFGITYGFATILWASSGGPPPRPAWQPRMRPSPSATARPEQEPAPPPTPWPAERRADIRGTVRDAAGRPVPGALVYVSRGLEAMSFAVPSQPLSLVADHRGVRDDATGARAIVLREHQPLRARSGDGRLHNLVASPHGDASFNVPLLASGAWQRLPAPGAGEPIPLKCIVHAPHEAAGHLAVLHHPHHALSGPDGRFELPDVPVIAEELTVFDPDLGRARASVKLGPGTAETVELRLAAPAAG